jgi:hypothetical protein
MSGLGHWDYVLAAYGVAGLLCLGEVAALLRRLRGARRLREEGGDEA